MCNKDRLCPLHFITPLTKQQPEEHVRKALLPWQLPYHFRK